MKKLGSTDKLKHLSSNYEQFEELISKIDDMSKKGRVVIAIDGGSASGKTTLSELLSNIYECTVIHMDDFFLQSHQRTKERFAEIGGNIDRERFLEEVLIPLKKKDVINYRKFDCKSMTLSLFEQETIKSIIIIEGVYSMHPLFEEYYDLSVFLDVSTDLQKTRIFKRNSLEYSKRFFDEWIPLENKYFNEMNVKERCKIVILIKE